jgi:hypothetical protein
MAHQKHYRAQDFVVTERNERGNKYGYCRVCKADMQQFTSDGILRHYQSHKTARALGIK